MLAAARRNWLIWFAVVPVALWTLVRVFGVESGFPLVPLMAFTPYAVIAAFFAAGIAVALRNWAAAVVAALATFCLAVAVLPRAVGDDTVQAAGHETLDVLSINIHHGTADPAAFVALVDRFEPDLVSVQELTPSFAAKLERAGLGSRLPEAILSMHRGASGAGLYAALPMRQIEPEVPVFAFRMPRAELTLPDGRRVRVVGVHPYPPGRGNVDIWEEALESLPSAGAGVPWILAGDFNATLDQAELRAILNRGYRDAGDVAAMGLAPTWPAGQWASRLPPVTIDHVLADRRLGVAQYSVEEMPGSDHHPVRAELVLP